jgi:hypothetical protein
MIEYVVGAAITWMWGKQIAGAFILHDFIRAEDSRCTHLLNQKHVTIGPLHNAHFVTIMRDIAYSSRAYNPSATYRSRNASA